MILGEELGINSNNKKQKPTVVNKQAINESGEKEETYSFAFSSLPTACLN
jgi:hypothetical protein